MFVNLRTVARLCGICKRWHLCLPWQDSAEHVVHQCCWHLLPVIRTLELLHTLCSGHGWGKLCKQEADELCICMPLAPSWPANQPAGTVILCYREMLQQGPLLHQLLDKFIYQHMPISLKSMQGVD